jgi:hypothetical protein
MRLSRCKILEGSYSAIDGAARPPWGYSWRLQQIAVLGMLVVMRHLGGRRNPATMRAVMVMSYPFWE